MPSSAPHLLKLRAGIPYTPKTDETWVNQQDYLEAEAEVLQLRARYQ
jgi:hypothetical protein